MRKNDEAIPEILNMEMLHTGNSALRTGSFECSSELMNRTFKLIDWAIRSNMQSVVTDCPHREKLGWAEVVHLMGNSIRYNYSLYHLYRKIIRDMIQAQRENGLIPDIAPEYVVFSGGFVDSPEWGSASVIVPWLVYKWYGDRNILEEAYPMMSKYVGYLESKSENHILSHGLGDWFDYGPEAPGVAQLTPVSLTATAIYYYDVRLLSEIATVLGKKHDAELYTAWANKIKNAFNDKFYDPVNKTYSTSSQTAIAMPLCVGLVDDADKEAVYSSLCRSIEKGGYALTAGDVGFHFLVSALSQNQSSSEVLYKMVNRSDVPGYGYQLAKGATALTESWPALEVVSNNHMMLGHVMEWFYTCLLGINDASDAVASDKIVLRPMPVGDITWAKGSYLSPRGPIDVDWKKQEGKFTLKCSIPDGVEARIVVPQGYTVIGKTHPAVSSENIESADGNVSVKVMGGKYEMSFLRK
ncbi:MAG: alpha-L-rhamnosidase C-terminal domain-containing protein [Bacteroidales bacterium]|nr:alpha-L-rhamnosidase C-terminal domain-containing protein [Bacteroidales bacterium]